MLQTVPYRRGCVRARHTEIRPGGCPRAPAKTNGRDKAWSCSRAGIVPRRPPGRAQQARLRRVLKGLFERVSFSPDYSEPASWAARCRRGVKSDIGLKTRIL